MASAYLASTLTLLGKHLEIDPQEQPKKVAVVGAGYIAVELAGVFQSLGTDTTLVVRGDRPLRPFDKSIVEVLVSEMAKSGLKLKTHSTPEVSKPRILAFSHRCGRVHFFFTRSCDGGVETMCDYRSVNACHRRFLTSEHLPARALFVFIVLQAVTKEADGTLTLALEGGESIGGFDQVLLATGRRPMLEKLGLESAGVNTDRGYITVR